MACTCQKVEKPPFELVFRQEQRGFHIMPGGDYGRIGGMGWSFSSIQEAAAWLLEQYSLPEGAK